MAARLVLSLTLAVALAAPALATPARPVAGTRAPAPPARWQTLPLPPAMPPAVTTGTVVVGGARIYYATYGTRDCAAAPVILLHGGMGNADHFGFQLPALLDTFHVIAIDTRGHGRSTLGKGKLGYHVMAGDVLAVMDELELGKAALVGWSDGGAVALDLAIHHPTRVDRLFILGTNYDARGSKPRTGKPSATFTGYAAKCRADHAKLTRRPRSFAAMIAAMRPVWRSPGGFTRDQLRGIGAPAMITLGAHDEIIERHQIEEMARLIPDGRLRVFDDASHFALWQAPDEVNAALVGFLTAK